MLRLRSHSDFIAFGAREKSLTGASVSADQVTYSNIFMIIQGAKQTKTRKKVNEGVSF